MSIDRYLCKATLPTWDVYQEWPRCLANEAKHKLVFQPTENTSFANSSDTETLRPLVTRVHQRRLPDFSRLLDTSVRDPLFQERIQRIHAQVTVG